MYFRAFEARYTAISYSFMPKLTLHRPDWSSNQSKIALETMGFGLCEDLKDVLHILNPPVFILWIWLKVVVLRWRLWIYFLPFYSQMWPQVSLRVTFQKSSHESTFARDFATLCMMFWWVLNHFIFVLKQWWCILGLLKPDTQPHPIHSCQSCPSHRPDWLLLRRAHTSQWFL